MNHHHIACYETICIAYKIICTNIVRLYMTASSSSNKVVQIAERECVNFS